MRTRKLGQYDTAGSRGKAYYYYYDSVRKVWLGPYGGYNIPSVSRWIDQRLCCDELHAGPPYRDGGPLTIFRKEIEGYYSTYTVEGLPYRCTTTCHDICHAVNPTGWTDAALADPSYNFGLNVDSLGATGWNKFKPGKPLGDLAVFLGELRQAPSLAKRVKEFLKDYRRFRDMKPAPAGVANKLRQRVSEDWLEANFGWLPILRDVQKFLRAITEVDSRIDRIVRYNGKWESRGGTFVTNHSEEPIVEYTGSSGFLFSPTISSTMWDVASARTVVRRTNDERVWFEGSFRYWIPEKDLRSPLWRKKALLHQLGGFVSPSTVWNLLPWSWLVDWVGNFGDVIANSSNGLLDQLVARYAYVMGTKEFTQTTSHYAKGKTSGSVSFTTTYRWIYKRRCEATPFGFGLSWDSFTPWQLSILAALGLNRKN